MCLYLELAEISKIDELLGLYYYNCPKLLKIPNIQELKVLNCSDCPELTEIQNNLQELNCSDCRKLAILPNAQNYRIINVNGCIWLNVSNSEYEENIVKLKKLQMDKDGYYEEKIK